MCDPKTCSACGKTLDRAFFNKDRTRVDGLDPRCKDCTRAACRAVYQRHREKHVALKRRWKAENRPKPEQREKSRVYTNAWRAANPEKVREQVRLRQTVLRRATPPWVDMRAIKTFYANRPPGHHVDHIEPLQGKDRSGLHVPWNLQYLPIEVSLRKYNHTDGGYNL